MVRKKVERVVSRLVYSKIEDGYEVDDGDEVYAHAVKYYHRGEVDWRVDYVSDSPIDIGEDVADNLSFASLSGTLPPVFTVPSALMETPPLDSIASLHGSPLSPPQLYSSPSWSDRRFVVNFGAALSFMFTK